MMIVMNELQTVEKERILRGLWYYEESLHRDLINNFGKSKEDKKACEDLLEEIKAVESLVERFKNETGRLQKRKTYLLR